MNINIETYENLTQKEYYDKLKYFQDIYTNENPEISDEFFDYLVEFYENKFNEKFEIIGAEPIILGSENKLTYYMPSLNKIKGYNSKIEKKLNNFIQDTSGKYLIMDKLDGCSIQLTITENDIKISTRGDGFIGNDVSKISKYLKIPKIKKIKKIVIRGEIVMSKSSFLKYSEKELLIETNTNKLKNSRNTVNGFINSISKNFNKKISEELGKSLKLLDFIAYDIQYYDDKNLTENDKIKILKKIGFKTPDDIIVNEININFLKTYLIERKLKSEYSIDGIVIVDSEYINKINENKNPNYKLVYKLDTIKKSKVIDIKWNLSRHSTFIPIVYIEPIEILGTTISKMTGKNGRFLIENKIGLNSEIMIELSGDIIPNISGILKNSKAKDMIYPHTNNNNINENDYELNNSNVNYILKKINNVKEEDNIKYEEEDNEEVIISKFKYFIDTLNIEHIGKSTLVKLYKNGITTFSKLFDISIEDIQNINGIGEKNSLDIINGIKKALINCELNEIMASVSIFNGLGLKKITMILEEYPNILKMLNKSNEELINDIIKIKGFSDKTALNFIINLRIFDKFLSNHPQIKIKENIIPGKTDKIKIVLSGFTYFDDNITDKLNMLGYNIENQITKNTKYLIIKNDDKITSKIKKAQEYGICILFIDDFINLLS